MADLVRMDAVLRDDAPMLLVNALPPPDTERHKVAVSRPHNSRGEAKFYRPWYTFWSPRPSKAERARDKERAHEQGSGGGSDERESEQARTRTRV